MTDIIKLVKEFEGIIGALLGVALTLVLTNALNKTGSLKFTIYSVLLNSSIKEKTGKIDERRLETMKFTNEIMPVTLKFELNILNNSDTQRIISDIEFGFYKYCILKDKTIDKVFVQKVLPPHEIMKQKVVIECKSNYINKIKIHYRINGGKVNKRLILNERIYQLQKEKYKNV